MGLGDSSQIFELSGWCAAAKSLFIDKLLIGNWIKSAAGGALCTERESESVRFLLLHLISTSGQA